MSRRSQNSGDAQQAVTGLEARGKIGYFSTRHWLQQRCDAQAASVFSAVSPWLSGVRAVWVLYAGCTVSNLQKSSMVRLARYKAKLFFGWWK